MGEARTYGTVPREQSNGVIGEETAWAGWPGGYFASLMARRGAVCWPWLYPLLLGALDMLLWCGLYLATSRFLGPHNRFGLPELWVPLAVLMPALGLIGGYSPRGKTASLRYATEHLIACLVAVPAAMLAVYLVANYHTAIQSSRAVFGITAAGFTVLTLVARRSLWFGLQRFRAPRGLLVVADAAHARRFYRSCLAHDHRQPMHFLPTDPALVGHPVDGPRSPVFEGSATDLPDRLQKGHGLRYEAVVLAADTARLDPGLLEFLGTVHFAELPVLSIDSFYEAYWEKLPADQLTPDWPLQAGCNLVRHSVYSVAKRAVDVVLASAALLVLSPVLLLTALAVRLESAGPAIFRQTRVGQYRRLFTLYKFRTMREGSDRSGTLTAERDPRITRVGRWLRLTRLDELPQLFNVLVGDMSLIGPRAEWDKLCERYEKQIPFYHFRHLVRPGITGWAQVNYRYGLTLEDTLEKLTYDLYYIRNFSLGLDAAVVLKTIHTMLLCKGR